MLVIQMYVTLFPLIMAGVLNMAFCRSSVWSGAAVPIDGGRLWQDGQRLLGANKTWKGFWGMVFWGGFCQLFWAGVLRAHPRVLALSLLGERQTDFLFNGWFGLLLGLVYVLCELPNSFIKRRAAIAPGQAKQGKGRWFFILLDQVDSLLGCVGLLALYVPMSLPVYLMAVGLGGLTHLVVNHLLYLCQLRRTRY